MGALVAAELRKLGTVRTTLGFLLLAPALTGVLCGLELWFADQRTVTDARSALTNAGIAGLLMLVLGIVMTTGEHRHDTISSTLVATADRRRLLGAKAVAHALVSVAAGMAAALVAVAVCLPWLASQGAPTLGAGDLGGLLAGQLAYTALAGALGVGLGALFRSQALALVVVLIELLALEPTLARFVPVIDRFGPEGAAAALARAPNIGDLGQAAGLAVYSTWTLLALTAGAILFTRRDVA